MNYLEEYGVSFKPSYLPETPEAFLNRVTINNFLAHNTNKSWQPSVKTQQQRWHTRTAYQIGRTVYGVLAYTLGIHSPKEALENQLNRIAQIFGQEFSFPEAPPLFHDSGLGKQKTEENGYTTQNRLSIDNISLQPDNSDDPDNGYHADESFMIEALYISEEATDKETIIPLIVIQLVEDENSQGITSVEKAEVSIGKFSFATTKDMPQKAYEIVGAMMIGALHGVCEVSAMISYGAGYYSTAQDKLATEERIFRIMNTHVQNSLEDAKLPAGPDSLNVPEEHIIQSFYPFEPAVSDYIPDNRTSPIPG
jgi:hypothetical protein